MHTGFDGAADATAITASGADMSMTEPEERAGWPMHTGFVGDADATASAASGVDKSMTEPEERAGWRMLTGFAGDVETTTALRFGWVPDKSGRALACCPHS